jgi:AraC-like DNA-binding protein
MKTVKAIARGEGVWSFSPSEDGTLRVRRSHRSRKAFEGLDTMGDRWLLGIAEVRSGEIEFFTYSTTTKVSSGRYVIWMPAGSLVRSAHRNLDQKMIAWVGCAQSSCRVARAFIAREWKGRFPRSMNEVERFIERCGSRVEIEYNPAPGPLSQRAKYRIDRSFTESIPMSAIARQLRTSATVMGRAFKRDFDLTPVQYRNHLRVTAASFELIEGKAVTRVAEDVGFDDLSRFNKNFKAITRTQPSQFKPRKSPKKSKIAQ